MSLSFIFLAIVSLYLPGLSLALLFRIKSNLTLNSIALSYSLFFLLYTLLLYTGSLASYLYNSYLTILIVSFCYLIFYSIKNKHVFTSHKDAHIPFLIVFAVFIYHFFVGAYTEIPADLYAHLERYQFALNELSKTNLTKPPHLSNLIEQGYGWYSFLAILTKLAPISIPLFVESVSLISNSTFLLCIYFLAKRVFSTSNNTSLIALITVAFTCLHMGVNVFSFIRYYALAPTMLGFCLYAAAIATLISSIKKSIDYTIIATFLLISFFTLAALSNHTQEAMFIVVISSLIIGVHVFTGIHQKETSDSTEKVNKRFWLALTLLAITGFICVYLYAHANLTRAPNAHWRLWEFGNGFSLIPQISTLNLKFQFIRVVTLWGCFVYLLFILNWRRYRHNHFIIAGMISPFFTILNPFFVDLFLRLDNSTTLWRLTYIIPIHFVAADLFILYIQKLRNSHALKKTYPLIVITSLALLLMPIKNTWQKAHYSRVPTLQATQYENSLYYYADVLTFLESIEEEHQILTDPVTGYVISSMTDHTSTRRKFSRSNSYRTFTFEEYDNNPLSIYKGYLLLVNQRKQPVSKIGELSGHWSHRELQNINYYYPEQLIIHLTENAQLFEKLWESNGISIYRIN